MSTLANGTLVSWLRDLNDLDLTRDLEGRSLRVTVDGISWESPRLPEMPAERYLEFYYHMALTRAVDREIVKLSRKGLAFGKHLMCTGNEASAVGATHALAQEDWITLGIRDLGAFVARGVDPARLLAQACGRTTGLTGGWDGSLHMGSREHRIVGLVSHLGTLTAIGTGCAFAEQYRETGNAVLSIVGEGSTSTGDVHEALNIAAVLRLPIVILIENNQWAFGTPTRLQYAVPTLALRALAYGSHVEGYCIDGTNVLRVYQTVHDALARARTSETITIIESVSMRLEGHSLADPFTKYVPAAQLELWQKKDPIARFRALLLDTDRAESDELSMIDRRIADEVRAASIRAEAGELPDATNIESRVFAPSPPAEAAAPEDSGTSGPYYKAIHDGLQDE